jgi:hypothetical protein
MSIAPPPAPTYPYPPAPHKPRRRWPALAAAAAVGAIVAGSVTTLITFAVTSPATSNVSSSTPSTVTKTAAPPAAPAPLPAAEADAQTCRVWQNTDTLVTAAAASMTAIPAGMNITDPVVQNNPSLKAAVARAGDLFGQAAKTFEAGIASGTNPSLAGAADTTVSSLRTVSEAYKAIDPAAGNAIAVFQTGQQAVDWLCR